jgi:hypothetical protein
MTEMSSAATAGAKAVDRYDAKKPETTDALLKSVTDVLEADSDVGYLDEHGKEVLQKAQEVLKDKSKSLSEEALVDIRMILDEVKGDAKIIITEAKTEIETLVSEAGGDVIAATSTQGIRRMATGGVDEVAKVTNIETDDSALRDGYIDENGEVTKEGEEYAMRTTEYESLTPEAQT